jgi:hypothetical protein
VVETRRGSGVLLVEAKSHPREVAGSLSVCRAVGRNRARMSDALARAKKTFGAASEADWLGECYQYANRMAHLAFVLDHGVEAWLVFTYFVRDTSWTDGPKTREEWQPAIRRVEALLGLLPGHPREDRIIRVYPPADWT